RKFHTRKFTDFFCPYVNLLQRFITSLYSNLVLFGSGSSASSNSSTETFLIHTSDAFIWASRISIGKDRTSTRFIFRMLKNNVFISFPSFIDTLVISNFFISSLIKSRAAVCFFTTLSAALNSSDMSKLIKSSTRCSNRSILLLRWLVLSNDFSVMERPLYGTSNPL
ncbi:hypothetical protein DFS34DRAFT_409436, partial [Phlyctochytrium arcticum]